MAHQIDHVLQVLFKLNMVCRLELASNFTCLFQSKPKRHLELSKLVEIMETYNNKLLKNVKTRWISIEPTI